MMTMRDDTLAAVDEYMDAMACDGWPQTLPPGLRDLWASMHMRVQTALRERPSAQWDPDAVPMRSALATLEGCLVEFYADTPFAKPFPANQSMLLVAAGPDGIVVELRDGSHVFTPLARILSLRALDRACRVCGCTDLRACSDGCEWVEIDLCSACEERADQEPERPQPNAESNPTASW